MSAMNDIITDILEMHSRGYKTTSIAALLGIPFRMVEDALDEYAAEYLKAFSPEAVEQLYE